MQTRIVACEMFTLREHGGLERVLFYKLAIGRLGRFVRPEEMPAFHGKKGFVEVLGPATRLRVLRQVEQGAPIREATAEERRIISAYRKPK